MRVSELIKILGKVPPQADIQMPGGGEIRWIDESGRPRKVVFGMCKPCKEDRSESKSITGNTEEAAGGRGG